MDPKFKSQGQVLQSDYELIDFYTIMEQDKMYLVCLHFIWIWLPCQHPIICNDHMFECYIPCVIPSTA